MIPTINGREYSVTFKWLIECRATSRKYKVRNRTYDCLGSSEEMMMYSLDRQLRKDGYTLISITKSQYKGISHAFWHDNLEHFTTEERREIPIPQINI